MAKINFLPWREELKQQQNKEFTIMAAIAAAIACGIIAFVFVFFKGLISNQEDRNMTLRNEISVLDGQIETISELQNERNRLIERMQLIQNLQSKRAVPAMILQEIVLSLPPEGIYLTLIRSTSRRAANSENYEEVLTLEGVANSANTIANFIDNLNTSNLFLRKEANLKTVKEIEQKDQKTGATLRSLHQFALEKFYSVDPKVKQE